MINEILSIFNWAKDKLPIPNRLEAVKNEIDKLEVERNAILLYKADVKKANRLEYIDSRLYLLRKRLQNALDSK